MLLTIEEITSEIIDKRGVTVKKLGGDFVENGHRVISAKLIKNSKIDLNAGEERFVNKEIYKKWMSSKLMQGDVILTSEAPLGKVAYVQEDLDWCLGQRLFCLRPNTEILDGRYLFYSLKTRKVQADLESRGTGTTVLGIKQSELLKVQIPVQDIEVQKRISALLGRLDNKIELNQKMNETLEEIAKTLFKSWFIDFDPVRAKAEGRPTGLSKEISDLFPDSFEDSELGEIPKGWNLLTFGDFVTPIRGKVITKKTTNPGDIPVVAGGLEPAYFHSIANVEGPAVTISASGANAGYTNLYYEDIWASDCSYISNKQSSNVFTSYIFLKLNQERIFDSQHGAAQPHIYPDDLRRLDMVIPSNDLYETFENLITSFFNKIKLNIEETKNLISLRDTLLPKLISGELKIPDAEEIIEEARV